MGLCILLRAGSAVAAPDAMFTPPTHDFGAVLVGDSEPYVQRLDNLGTTSLSVSSFTLTGSQCSSFQVTPDLPLPTTVGSTGFMTFHITFVPTVRGPRTCTLTLTDSDTDTDTVTLSGIGIAPVMTTNGAVTTCGGAAVNGGTTMTCAITVFNNGDAPLNYVVASSNSSEFQVAAGPSVAPAGFADVIVTFNPTAAGARTSTITISGNDPSNPSDTVSVSGTGLVPTITGLPSTVAIGNVGVGVTSSPSTLMLTNTGGATLNIASVSLTGGSASQFAIATGSTAAQTVLATGMTMWTVTCTPTSTGPKTATFRISSDAPAGVPSTNTDITLTCTGQQASFSATGTLTFGSIPELTTSTRSITITNNGNIAGDITAITPGASVYTYTVTGGDVPRTIAAGGNITVNVTYAPINGATTNTNLTITTTGSPATFTVPMTGDGIHVGVDLTVAGEDDLDVDLGDVRVGTLVQRTVTIENTSDVSLTVNAPASDDTHCAIVRITPTTYPTVLPAGGIATFRIDTTPDALGAEMCAITVTSTIPSTETVNVIVNGVAPGVALSSSMLQYGGVDLDNGPRTRTLSISNPGTAVLALTNCAVTGDGFTLDTPCPSTVEVGASAELTITMTPDAAGDYTGTFTANVDALAVSSISVPLLGHGGQGRVAADLALDFPDTAVADTRVRTINVQNTGDAELTIAAADVTADTPFTLGTELPIVLDGGDDVDLELEFAPDEVGFTEAELTLTTDDETRTTVVVSLTGTGVAGDAPDAGPGAGVDDPRTYYTCQTGGGTGLIAGLLLVLGVGALRRRRA